MQEMLFFLLHMLYRSIRHQISNQADKLALLAIILLSADVSPTYSRGFPQGNGCRRLSHCQVFFNC